MSGRLVERNYVRAQHIQHVTSCRRATRRNNSLLIRFVFSVPLCACSYITFEDVKVPVSHLIGKENEGFRYVMYNFNHERWSISIQASRFARVCLEESMRYAFKRRTFGKLLIEHPVIRLKLAHMARQVEASHALMESITYQLTRMDYDEAVRVLGGPIALAKAQVTTVFEYWSAAQPHA